MQLHRASEAEFRFEQDFGRRALPEGGSFLLAVLQCALLLSSLLFPPPHRLYLSSSVGVILTSALLVPAHFFPWSHQGKRYPFCSSLWKLVSFGLIKKFLAWAPPPLWPVVGLGLVGVNMHTSYSFKRHCSPSWEKSIVRFGVWLFSTHKVEDFTRSLHAACFNDGATVSFSLRCEVEETWAGTGDQVFGVMSVLLGIFSPSFDRKIPFFLGGGTCCTLWRRPLSFSYQHCASMFLSCWVECVRLALYSVLIFAEISWGWGSMSQTRFCSEHVLT